MSAPAQQTYLLHLPTNPDWKVYSDLCDHLLDFAPEAELLISGPKKSEFLANLADVGIWVQMPGDSDPDCMAFLDKYQPSAVAWIAGQLHGPMFKALATRGIPLHLVDCGEFLETNPGPRLLPRMRRSNFRYATTITIGDVSTMRMLRRERVPEGRIYFRGMLEGGATPPPVSNQDLDALSEALKARPTWLAAEIGASEIRPVVAVHAQALRRAHRLLLVLLPANMEDADIAARELAKSGLSFVRRSTKEDPTPDTQIILADVKDELGLWLRLCPVSYMGQTLTGHEGQGPNPFHAAALGSSIIHGSETGHHATAFARLIEAGATCQLRHPRDLTFALQQLLAADRAAELAQRAWQVSSADAEMHTHIAAMLAPSEVAVERPTT